MDPIFRVMCDVAGLVTRGSDAARMETCRMAAERERSVPANAVAVADRPVTSADEAPERAFVRPRKWLRAAFLPR